MKLNQNRGRGNNGRRRNTTPAVICLPQAKAQAAPPIKEPEALRAFALPRIKEPLSLSPIQDLAQKPARKPRNSPARTVAMADQKATDQAAETTPLPRNLSLILQPKSGLMVIGQWLRKLVMKPKRAALAVDTASAKTQVRALRVEVAQLQRSLDQLMAQLRAAERA